MPPFWKALLNRLIICSLCIMSIRIFGCFLFVFEDRTVVLTASVSGHCYQFTSEL